MVVPEQCLEQPPRRFAPPLLSRRGDDANGGGEPFASTSKAQKTCFELTGNLNEEQKEALRHLFGRRHRYDSQNRRIETSSTPADYDKITFAYNDQGDVISQISEVSNTEYNLAETGALTPLQETTRAHRSETNLRYQYDSNLNWTEKIVEAPGGPIWSIERRSITYFDM